MKTLTAGRKSSSRWQNKNDGGIYNEKSNRYLTFFDGNEQYNCNGGWNIGVSAYSSHKEEAKLLVKYWTSDDAMLIGATMSGKMPARPALYGNKDLLAADSDMAKLYDFAKNCRNRPGSAYYEEVSTALQEGVTSVLMGEQSIDNAVATIQAKEEEIYNR